MAMVVGQVGLNVCNLRSTAWPLTLVAEIPLALTGNFTLASVLVSILCPRRPAVAFWAFALLASGPTLVLVGLGLRSWTFVSWPVAFLTWFLLFSPTAKNVPLGLVTAVFGVGMQTGLLTFAEHLVTMRGSTPRVLHGMLMPPVVVLYEALSSFLVCRGWRRFYTSEVPLQLFYLPASIVVQTGEAMRLVGLLTASTNADVGGALQELAVGVGLSVVSDVLLRTLRVQKLLWSVVGRDYAVTPEHDAFLRARFEYGYTPHLYTASTALVMSIHGKRWAARPLLWVTMAAALIAEVLTDAVFVLLHWFTRRQAESPIQTLKRLLAPGGHQVLGHYEVARVSTEDAEADEDAGSMEEGTADVGCSLLPLQVLFQLVIADTARTSVGAAMYGNFGSCSDWFSAELCTDM